MATAYDRQPDHLAASDGMGRCLNWFGEGYSFVLTSGGNYHVSMMALGFLGCLLLLFNFCTPWLALLWLGSSALCFVGAAHLHWIATARLLEQVVRVRPPVWQDRVRYFALWTTLAFQIFLLSPIPFIFLQAFFWLIVRCFPADEEEVKLWIILGCLMLNLAIWVYVNIRLCFVTVLILDQGMNFYSAMRWSWIMTGRRPLRMVAFHLLGALILALGAMVCLVGLLYSVPVVQGALLAAYRWEWEHTRLEVYRGNDED